MLSERVLLGPGPSLLPPAVVEAMSRPQCGHMDPDLLPLLDETVGLLRRVFQTRNELTLPVSGSGTAGMEATLRHLLSDEALLMVCTAGYFGDRIATIGRQVGAQVARVEAPWGRPVDPADLERALRAAPAVERVVVAAVHVETSTGVLQALPDLARVAHAGGAAIMADAVASLGGVEVLTDAWALDACYAGSQKCLSAPPGLAPVTVHARTRRGEAPSTFYLDLEALWQYWGPLHVYHHTVPVPLVYGLHAALRLVVDEGLEARVARHHRHAQMLWRGLEALGLQLFVPEADRAPTLTTVRVPAGVDDERVRARLLRDYGIEIAGGLGPLRGAIWRIGLMGHSSQVRHVVLLLGALAQVLAAEGLRVPAAAEVARAALQAER